LVSHQQFLQVKKDPEKESYKTGEPIMLTVQGVEEAEFYVWRIDGYGQRVIETKDPYLRVAFSDTSNLSKHPVEIGIVGARGRIDLGITVSAYNNHYCPRLLAKGTSELAVVYDLGED